MSSPERILSFSLAINEALSQTMAADSNVLLMGQGVKSPWYVGNTCCGLAETFGDRRVIDTPVSENAITGAGVGAAIAGLRTVVIHPRMDFMIYALDPIVNQAANWRYMSGGTTRVPVVFWGIVNRGGEQGAQHSQALQAWFVHVPGLKVVAPATPRDAKGLMTAAILDDDPVVFIDDRSLYENREHVPQELFAEPIGAAALRRAGTDVTIIAFSSMLPVAIDAANELAREGVDAEVIDLRTLKPLDWETVCRSVRNTGRAVVCDTGWLMAGVAAEVSAGIMERCWFDLKAPVARVALPDVPAPAARTLEAVYYRTASDVINACRNVLVQSTEPLRASFLNT